MSSMLVLMVHNRLDMFEQCLNSMFSNTNFQFSEILICNDGSNRGTTKRILDYVYEHSGIKDVNLMHFSRNQGQGCILEFILNYATYKNPKYLFLLEQDYIWRKNWAEEAVAVLQNSTGTIMVPATSHKGYYKESAKYKTWPKSILDHFGDDPLPRKLMFKPFDLKIKNNKELQIREKIKVQGVSNSTTCNIVDWRKFHKLRENSNKIFNGNERFWKEAIRKACGIGNSFVDNRSIVDDGILSQGICYFWYKTYADKINKEKDFPILDICDHSIGNHLDVGGHHSAESFNFGYATDEDGNEFFADRASTPKWTENPPVALKNKPKAFVLRAPYSTSSGYETLITTITDELIKGDYDFYLEPVGPTKDKHLKKYKKYFEKTLPPEKFDCPELFICPMQVTDEGLRSWGYVPEKKRTLMTMWETSEINSQTAAEMSKMDKIIVPNHWNKRAIEKRVTQVPVHVVPLFADAEIFKYKEKKQSKVFMFGAGNSDPRKQLDKLISAFLKAFPSARYSADGKRVLVDGNLEKNEGVVLVLKGSAGDEKRRFTDNRIKYITERLSTEEMADWYASLDCFVSIASAEGWGLMQHEAMACGTAVIAPLYAGLTEFMNQENCYPIKYKEVLADVSPWDITAGGLWSKYDEDHLIESMRHCYYNREEVHKRGKLAAEQVKKLTIKNTVNKIKEAMEIE